MPEAVDNIVEAFAAALQIANSDALRAGVAAAWHRAREAHPACELSPIALFRYLAERLDDRDPIAALAQRHIDDLYLACGCALGDPAAIAALERDVLPRVERGLQLSPDERREVMQDLRERMLVAKPGRRGIAAYDGRAPLATWLRVCAVRIGRNRADRERRAIERDDAIAQIAPGVPDPELAYLKRHYGAQFRAAFGDAVASLTPRERNLLRYSVIDGLGIDQIAAIYHMHRATAARQLNRARRVLADATRERMRVALGVSERELESILRVLMSMTAVTLQQVLARRGVE